jgi:hypothetical protein
MEVSNNDLYRAYRVTGEVTQCSPYKCNYAYDGSEYLEPPESHPSRDRGQRGIADRDASHTGMYHVWEWIAT